MKERPVLFNGPMVRAILSGAKTQTRRLLAAPPDVDAWRTADGVGNAWTGASAKWHQDEDGWHVGIPGISQGPWRPPADAGDRLWVRESFRELYFDNGGTAYRADWDGKAADVVPEPKWTPSIHMRRRHSRLTLAVESVRVERLQSITEADAVAEGFVAWHPYPTNIVVTDVDGKVTRTKGEVRHAEARSAFCGAWSFIYGSDSWTANPWVWVTTFSRVPT